jgi:hypothetical protein
MLAGKKLVHAMYVNVGHINHSVERERQNVHVFWNTVSASSIPPPIFYKRNPSLSRLGFLGVHDE